MEENYANENKNLNEIIQSLHTENCNLRKKMENADPEKVSQRGIYFQFLNAKSNFYFKTKSMHKRTTQTAFIFEFFYVLIGDN